MTSNKLVLELWNHLEHQCDLGIITVYGKFCTLNFPLCIQNSLYTELLYRTYFKLRTFWSWVISTCLVSVFSVTFKVEKLITPEPEFPLIPSCSPPPRHLLIKLANSPILILHITSSVPIECVLLEIIVIPYRMRPRYVQISLSFSSLHSFNKHFFETCSGWRNFSLLHDISILFFDLCKWSLQWPGKKS